jgi:hypothetical protein
MKKIVFPAALIPALLLVSSTAYAFSWSFNDPCAGDASCTYQDPNYAGPALYYGGDGYPDPSFPQPGGDTIGGAADYDILNLTAQINSNNLTVSVLTRFVEDTASSNVLYGDLMLSTLGYNPYVGITAPIGSPYVYDTATTTSTVWNYVVSTSSANITEYEGTGTGTLYKDPTSFVTADFAPNDGLHRSGQNVLYGAGGTPFNNVTVAITHPSMPNGIDGIGDVDGTLLTYTIPLSDLVLPGGAPLEKTGVAIRWAMTCANDIVEAYAVSEPETIVLFMGGLLSLVWTSRLRKSAKVVILRTVSFSVLH